MKYRESDPVSIVPGIGPAVSTSIDRLGIKTLGDLLHWYPRAYLDASRPVNLAGASLHRLVVIEVTVSTVSVRRSKGRGVPMLEAVVTDSSGRLLTVRWFNQPYLKQKLTEGSRWLLIGELTVFNKELQMTSPLLEDNPRVLAIYAQTQGVTSKMFRGYVEKALASLEWPTDPLPLGVREREGLLEREAAIRQIHRPLAMAEVEAARKRVAFEEVFWFFIRLLSQRDEARKETGTPISIDLPFLQQAVADLPFALTAGQKRAIWDILNDMKDGRPMTRLLNGDVGSGKTAVAGTVAAVVARAGYQSILLVPTEILAKQHQESLHKLFQGRLSVVLWTAAQKDEVEKADIVVGTHAVLKEGFGLPRLALVVIDEQHRFGVRQRQHLRTSTGATPHMLSLSATPIPRTLALALYGDLAVSFLPDKPKDRLPVITRVIHASSRPSMHSCIMKEIEEGHQVFVICPLIEEKKGESGEVDETQFSLLTPEEYEREEKKTVVAEAGRLRREHPEYGLVEAIHGKMKAEEKRQIMDRMQKGEIQVLVATSVIEVGVDVSNATVMVIEGAERFGLAQLHQFRGRVGRGGRQSYCFLCPALRGQVIDERLKVLEESDSGFVIAEKDLQLRGPGELGGSLQAGLPDFRMASLTDTEFLLHVKGVAEECLREDATILEKLSVGGSSIVRASLE